MVKRILFLIMVGGIFLIGLGTETDFLKQSINNKACRLVRGLPDESKIDHINIMEQARIISKAFRLDEAHELFSDSECLEMAEKIANISTDLKQFQYYIEMFTELFKEHFSYEEGLPIEMQNGRRNAVKSFVNLMEKTQDKSKIDILFALVKAINSSAYVGNTTYYQRIFKELGDLVEKVDGIENGFIDIVKMAIKLTKAGAYLGRYGDTIGILEGLDMELEKGNLRDKFSMILDGVPIIYSSFNKEKANIEQVLLVPLHCLNISEDIANVSKNSDQYYEYMARFRDVLSRLSYKTEEELSERGVLNRRDAIMSFVDLIKSAGTEKRIEKSFELAVALNNSLTEFTPTEYSSIFDILKDIAERDKPEVDEYFSKAIDFAINAINEGTNPINYLKWLYEKIRFNP